MSGDKKTSVARPHGTLILTGLDGEKQFDTLQCCHCSQHFVIIPGSGRKRGFCRCCMQVTCGAEACDRCVPFEKQMEAIERAAAGR
jgi:hypothetical protein